MRKPLLLVCAAALVLAVAGCGSSGSSEGSGDDPTTTAEAGAATTTTAAGDEGVTPTDVTAEEYAAAFVAGMTSGSAEDGDLVLPQASAECVAPKFVEIITVETLNEGGVTEEDASDSGFSPSDIGLDQEQGEQLVSAFGDCGFDIFGELAAALAAGFTEEQEQCTADNLDHELAAVMLAKTFSTGENDAELEALLADLRQDCDLPE